MDLGRRGTSSRCAGMTLLVAMAAGGCHRAPASRPPGEDGVSAWDRAAFVIQLAREEYREQTEAGDFAVVPLLTAQIDLARTALEAGAARDARERWLDGALGDLRAALVRHEAARTVAKTCARVVGEMAMRGIALRAPGARPDLGRGAALYQTACAPCHGPPRGPPTPAGARLVPPPPRPTESALTPYEIFDRVTFGGVAGTPMPSFAESLSAIDRWSIAFYLFADRWPACQPKHWPALPAAALAHQSDYDLWKSYGWGAAPCLRRDFR